MGNRHLIKKWQRMTNRHIDKMTVDDQQTFNEMTVDDQRTFDEKSDSG